MLHFLLNHMFLSEINGLLWPHMCKVAILEVLLLLKHTSAHLHRQIICPQCEGGKKTEKDSKDIVLLSISFLADTFSC